MATQRIVLVRHGRSAHVVRGLLDLRAFLKWRDDYDAAGIDAAEVPPPELVAVAREAGMLVSSDTRRAVESARTLAGHRDIVVSPLVGELSLEPPGLRWIRLPLLGWAVAFAMRGLVREVLRRSHATAEEEERIRVAAQWLIELSSQHGDIVVLTHGSFRWLLAKEFARRGWSAVLPRRRSAHWSAWSFMP